MIGTTARSFVEDDITVFESSDDVNYSNQCFEAAAPTTRSGWDPELLGKWVEVVSVITGFQCFMLCGGRHRSIGGGRQTSRR